MKRTVVVMSMLLMVTPALAAGMQMDHMKGGGGMMGMAGMHGDVRDGDMHQSADDRIPLNLPAPMRRHQLAMMREHLQAVNEIIAYISEGKFDDASDTAHQRLGLTPEMKRMCNMFGNDNFRMMGLAFHQSADELGDVLKTGDLQRSLAALHVTMERCVSCHATFRQ